MGRRMFPFLEDPKGNSKQELLGVLLSRPQKEVLLLQFHTHFPPSTFTKVYGQPFLLGKNRSQKAANPGAGKVPVLGENNCS